MMFYKETNFKETPIGKIPKEWEVVSLRYIVESQSDIVAGPFGSNLKVCDYREDGVPIIRLQNIERNQFICKDIKYTSYEKAEELKYHSFQAEDIVLAKLGDPIGKACIVPPYFKRGIVVADVVRIRVSPKKASSIFVEYILNSPICTIQLEKEVIGTTRPRVNISQVRNLKLPLPSILEQQKIAKILSTVDEAIRKTDEVIAKTERLKKGLMQKLLTKGIGHKEFKYSKELGFEISKQWEVMKLGNVVELHDNKRIPLSEMERSTRKGSYPYCGANGVIDYIDDYIFDGEFVLLAEDGGAYGKFENSAYIMQGKFWVNNHAHVLRAIPNKTTNVFILFALNFLDLNPYIVGTTRKKLNQEQMKEIKIPLPPPPEQQKITETLSTADKKLQLERNEKAKLEKIKQGLMDLLLTGKVRIKVD